MAHNTIETLLRANPKAQRDEEVVRNALQEVRRLREGGFAGRGYTLTPPFGEKRQIRRQKAEEDAQRAQARRGSK